MLLSSLDDRFTIMTADIVNNDSLISVSTTSTLTLTDSFGTAFVKEATTATDLDL